MDLIAALAERKILEAMERGEFDDLPGKGKPLDLSDDPIVPEKLRVAYKVMKNAGYLPPGLELHNEIIRLRDLVDAAGDEAQRSARLKELNVKLLRFNIMRKRPLTRTDLRRNDFTISDRVYRKKCGLSDHVSQEPPPPELIIVIPYPLPAAAEAREALLAGQRIGSR